MSDTLLHITFEGDLPGLNEGGLSIHSFSASLPKLLAAYRRIASGIVSDAIDKPGYGGKGGGKYARAAEAIDLEILALTHNSPVTLELRCSSRPTDTQPHDLFSEELLEDAGKTLLRSIDLESKGHPRNGYVRSYLESLPKGLRSQRYKLSRNSQELGKITISSLALVEQTDWPTFEFVTGSITGVNFEPGNPEVKGKGEDGKASFSAAAHPADVDRAIDLRGQTIEAVLWRESNRRSKLIGIGPAGFRKTILNHDENKRLVFEEWDGALRRLAQ